MVDPTPQLTFADTQGRHNSDLIKTSERLIKARSSVDLSTICIIPSSGLIPAKVAENWLYQTTQMNQKFMRLMMIGMEKYNGFNNAIVQILSNPALSSFKYILTLEEDVTAPIDGLLKLFEDIDKYDVVGALGWSKGMGGKPMIYGHPQMVPLAFTPVTPMPETVQPCLAVGTGFALFKISIFMDPRVPLPWFHRDSDMFFFENIHKLGYKVACDTRVRVGHYDVENSIFW